MGRAKPIAAPALAVMGFAAFYPSYEVSKANAPLFVRPLQLRRQTVHRIGDVAPLR